MQDTSYKKAVRKPGDANNRPNRPNKPNRQGAHCMVRREISGALLGKPGFPRYPGEVQNLPNSATMLSMRCRIACMALFSDAIC